MFSCLGYDDNKALSHKITRGGNMRIGSLVKHIYPLPLGYGVVTKVHEMLDYNGHTRVDVHWANIGTRTENRIILREVTCE